jgi:tryptophan synthase beta subunit
VKGYFEKVDANEIKEALNVFYLENYFIEKFRNTGICVGLEASTALAGIIKMREENIIHQHETILLNVSGEAKPGDIPKGWLSEELIKTIY